MGFTDWVVGLQGKAILKRERKVIERMLGNGHLVYLDKNRVRYTNKEGTTTNEISIDEMAQIFVDNVGGSENLLKVGLTISSIKNVLIEYQKKGVN